MAATTHEDQRLLDTVHLSFDLAGTSIGNRCERDESLAARGTLWMRAAELRPT